MPQLTHTFMHLARVPTHIIPDDTDQIERHAVVSYQKTSEFSHVNEDRKHLSTHNRKMENIPPTLNALEHHVKRAVYQAGAYLRTDSYNQAKYSPTRIMGMGWKIVKDDSPMDSMPNHSFRGSQRS